MNTNLKLGLESLVAFVAAYALCIGIAPVVKMSPMFVSIGAGLAYFVYQRMSVEEYYYEEDAEDETTYSAPPKTLLDAYERSTTRAQNNVLEHLWDSGEMQDFLQMKGCYAPSVATAATSGSMAEINDDMFDFDASDCAEQQQTKDKDEDGLISPMVDETPARPNMAMAIDEDNFDLFDDELESASIDSAPAVEESALDCCAAEEDDMFFDDSLLDEDEEDDDDIVVPQEPETEKE